MSLDKAFDERVAALLSRIEEHGHRLDAFEAFMDRVQGASATDRRTQPRQLTAGKRVRKAKQNRAGRTCPVDGCVRKFSPATGGYCSDHRNTAGFKAWKKQNAKAKAGK